MQIVKIHYLNMRCLLIIFNAWNTLKEALKIPLIQTMHINSGSANQCIDNKMKFWEKHCTKLNRF